MSRTVRSPDGRTWTLERARPESVISAAKKEPVFWGSIILTALMIGFIVWITIRYGVGIFFIVTVVVFVIWLIERGFSSARPNLTAHTDGPPPQTFTWRTTHRYGLSGMEDKIVAQIQNGDLGQEPPGTVLVGI